MTIHSKTLMLFSIMLTATLFTSCLPPVSKPGDDIVQIPDSVINPSDGGNNNPGKDPNDPGKDPENPVIPGSKNTDEAIQLTVYDVTAKSAYFKGVFGDILPEGYSQTPPRGFMYSTEYSDGEDIYMYGKWVNPLMYKTEGDPDNVFRAYVSDLTPGATIYVIACVDYVNEVTYRYSPVMAMQTVVNSDYNGQEYVDLGLSVKWAKYNVGASSETEKGQYFSWGETATKDNYQTSNYLYYAGTNNANGWNLYNKYVTFINNGTIDNIVALQPEDDAAHVVMGGTWRMPHDSEYQELIDKCTWLHSDEGVTIMGPNGNSIFLPLTGLISGSETYWDDCGYYRGAEVTLNDNSNSCCLEFKGWAKSEKLVNASRSGGYAIRAVTD